MAGRGEFNKEKNTRFECSTASAVDKGRRSSKSGNKVLLRTIFQEDQKDDEVGQRGNNISIGYVKENAGKLLWTMTEKASCMAASNR